MDACGDLEITPLLTQLPTALAEALSAFLGWKIKID
jgi:hypothetical protein